MDAVLLQRLSQITEEERELLQGRGVDRALYASGRAFEVDAAKMLEKGKLMSIRPHTRFARFRGTATIMWRSCICAVEKRCTASTGMRL